MDKICILIPSFGTGGAEKVGLNLANYYASEGLDVDLVVILRFGGYRGLVASGVNVVDLDLKRARYSVLPLRKYFKCTRPTVVLSVLRGTSLYAAAACVGLRGAPALHFREANPVRDLDLGGGFQAALLRRLMKLAYRRASSIISNSEVTRDDLVAHGIIEEGGSTVIPNPVLPGDFDVLAREHTDHPWLNDPNLKVVLSVGRLYPQKNQRLLIQAFRIVASRQEQARLLILGEGPERGRLEEQISACGLEGRVELHDFVQNPFPYYAKADVFVLTSDYEGFGNVLPKLSDSCWEQQMTGAIGSDGLRCGSRRSEGPE